jgi:hypothetical protein
LLVDREVDGRAHHDRNNPGNAPRSVQPRPRHPDERDADEREREVQCHELPPEAGGDTRVTHVVEQRRREARVRRDNGDAVEENQRNQRANLPRHTPHGQGEAR